MWALHSATLPRWLSSKATGAEAARYWQRSTAIIKRRAERGLASDQGRALGREVHSSRLEFWGLVKAGHRLPGRSPKAMLGLETFETAQWLQASEAAASLAQMAARSAKGSPRLALLVRERQDLVGEWQAKDKLFIASKSELPAKRRPEAEKALADRLAAIDRRRAEIDRRLAQDFPDYAALASPLPVSAAEVQTQLGTDEALVLFLDTPAWQPLSEETFVWAVNKTEARWVRSDYGTAALTREVAALRCGLDATAWMVTGVRSVRRPWASRSTRRPAPTIRCPLITPALTSCICRCSARCRT